MDGICKCQQGTDDCIFVEEGVLTKYYCQQPSSLQAKPLDGHEKVYNSGLAIGADASIDVIIDDGTSEDE